MYDVCVKNFPQRVGDQAFPVNEWVTDVSDKTLKQLQANSSLKIEVRKSGESKPEPEPSGTGSSDPENPLGGAPGDGQARETAKEIT